MRTAWKGWCCLWLLGCCLAANGALAPLVPEPDGARVFAAWQAITNDAAVRKTITSSAAATGGVLVKPGVVALDADFNAKPSAPRAFWDVRIPCDLRLAPGLQFDFRCEDLAKFSSFSCYFKSGKGWYHGSFSPEENGVWQRVTVLKDTCGVEEHPEGWGKVSVIRISGWRAGMGKVRCEIANMAPIGGVPEVAVVYADSLAAKDPGLARGSLNFGGNASASLRALGVESVLVADTDLATETLRGMKAVVLPYNPQMPAGAIACLKEYVSRGGRLLACYSQPQGICDLLGVKITGSKRPGSDGGAAIAGFLRTGNGLQDQPEFATQASWMTTLPARTPDVLVVAEWGDGKGRSLGIPALVRTKTGLYMSHVWLGGTTGAQAGLMRAIAGDLAPSFRSKIAAHEEAAWRKAEAARAWLAGRPSRENEHRAFWCHSAWGLGGDRDWDASIRFLKENGFNAMIANLAWGGAAFYPSQVLPVMPEVAARGDAFAQCRAACRKYGVKMHVWKVCWNMGAYTAQTFVDKMGKAGRTQVDVHGKAFPRWLCPSHPENQALEIEAMLELAKKGPDGIHFDYIRYPGSECCYCAGCRTRFEARLGHSVTNWPADVHGERAPLRAAWCDFRAANIATVVKTVSERVRRETPGVQLSAAVFADPRTVRENVGQDWPAWCREGWLDFVCPMDYMVSTAMYRSRVKSQMPFAGKARLYPGIGLSCWPNDGEETVRLAKQIEAVRALGLEGYTVFNFDRRAENALPLLHAGVTKLP